MCARCGRAGAMSFLQYNVSLLVRNYRVRGHILAKFNPLGNLRISLPELDPEYYGLFSEDLDLLFTFGYIAGQKALPLREILEILKENYSTGDGEKVVRDLSFNPTHLEFVGLVAQGALNACQIKSDIQDSSRGLLILIHGDASMAGEGIVQETLNLTGLAGFSVGGILHVMVNNQIGFTTPAGRREVDDLCQRCC